MIALMINLEERDHIKKCCEGLLREAMSPALTMHRQFCKDPDCEVERTLRLNATIYEKVLGTY